MTQEKALQLAKEGHNIFLTGNAGTGKTYTLNKIIKELKKQGKIVAVTASTGIASTHINGSTIHSWSSIGIRDKLSEEDFWKIRNNKFSHDRINSADVNENDIYAKPTQIETGLYAITEDQIRLNPVDVKVVVNRRDNLNL